MLDTTPANPLNTLSHVLFCCFCYPLLLPGSNEIKGLYQKRGWWYYQAPMADGVRPPAVALRTKDAGEAVDKTFELHSKGALHSQSKDSMEDLLKEYLVASRAARGHTAKTSYITQKCLEALAREWGNPRVSAIDRKKVEQWRSALQARAGRGGSPGDERKMSDASIVSYLRRLSGFLSWLVRERHLRSHPMEGIKLGQVRKTRRERFCTVEERELLLADPPSEEVNWILHLGFFAGLRFGEMLAMQASWWTPREGGGWVLTVQETPFWKPKDKECRTIEVHPRLAEFANTHGLRKPFVVAPTRRSGRSHRPIGSIPRGRSARTRKARGSGGFPTIPCATRLPPTLRAAGPA